MIDDCADDDEDDDDHDVSTNVVYDINSIGS